MLHTWPANRERKSIIAKPHASYEDGAFESNGTFESNDTKVYGLFVPCTLGKFGICASLRGVAMVFFPGFSKSDIEKRLEKHSFTPDISGQRRAVHAGEELIDYLSGKTAGLKSPVDLSYLTSFKRDVYGALIKVAYGETITYGELAQKAGHPGKARAVGNAMSQNPIPVFVPCHRVVSASGEGGWSGPKGWKQKLLKLEQR